MKDARTLSTSIDRSRLDDAAPKSGGSVMFSLSALVAQGAPAPPASSRGRATQDRSGMIDLTALAGGPIEVPAHVPVLPFGPPAAPPVVADIPAERAAPPSALRARRLAVIAAAAIAGAAVATALLAPRPTLAGSAAAGVAPSMRSAVAALPPAAEPPPAAPIPEPPAAQPRPSDPRPTPVRPQPQPRRDPAPTPKPPPGDPCHGDLLCAMQRATRG
ncbi:MAG: hypothetical protein IT372_30630 [Polyangiaceae bacterium]|nr:hypothetical protein [Polyangiaceae bacterium]